MGADLYRDDHDTISEQHSEAFAYAVKQRDTAPTEAEKEHWQTKVSEAYDLMYDHPYYFRDSYNNSSLFSKLDLSWWGDLEFYFGPNGDGDMEKITEDGEEYSDQRLYPEGARRLEQAVRERAELLAYNLRDLDEEWRSYFFEKYDTFLDFLRQSAEGSHTIRCSV